MNSKKRWLFAGILLMFVFVSFFCTNPYPKDQFAPIDEWSRSLGICEEFNWAILSRKDGEYTIRYDVPTNEPEALIMALSRNVKEENAIREYPVDIEVLDSRLTLQYEGVLWSFLCYTDDYVRIDFQDAETAAYYGCADSVLFIKSRELWNYIVSTLNEQGRITKMPLT